MTPVKIVKRALERNLTLIAITDHNSAENVAAVVDASRRTGLHVLPGMEVTTSEEVHIIGLFKTVSDVLSLQALVYDQLQLGDNDESLFGIQVVANAVDEVEGINTRLLIGATTLNAHQVIAAIHHRDGLAVAAHIDRPSFSILSQLGFVSEDMGLDAAEVTRGMTWEQARAGLGIPGRLPVITSSDAHAPEEIGESRTRFRLAGPDLSELKLALDGRKGRAVLPWPGPA
jgi:predicted metal-dependent phosphoesterase TrpH